MVIDINTAKLFTKIANDFCIDMVQSWDIRNVNVYDEDKLIKVHIYNYQSIVYNVISCETYAALDNYEVAKWLRDNYKIDVLPILRPTGKYSYDIYSYEVPNSLGTRVIRRNDLNSFSDFNICFNTGLFEALKMIDK